jgi:hypothetical protein
MLDNLGVAHYLPDSFEPDPTQQSTLTINPSMLDNLGVASTLQQFPAIENKEILTHYTNFVNALPNLNLGMEARRHVIADIIV